MTLLSPLALLVGLTALVPLVLHLYQQRRRTVIEFSSNRFFTASIVRAQRRLRLRRLLLLLVRVATCLLLALALARPLMTLAGFGGRAGTRDVVILLDDSLSMQAGAAVGTRADLSADAAGTRFERARQMAVDVLSELAAGDRAAVLTFTGAAIGDVTRSGLELSGDLLHLIEEVERLPATFAAGDARTGLARAAELLADTTPRNRLLLVLSDLQAVDWRQAEWPQPPQPVALALVRTTAGRDAGRHVPGLGDNVVADQMLLSQGAAVAGQPNLLELRLVNYRRATTPAELVLEIDGEERVRRPIELPGQSPHVQRIPLQFDQPGEHRLKLHVSAARAGRDSGRRIRTAGTGTGRYIGDALPADNTLYASVRVNPRLPVLVVNGRAEAGRGRSAAFFLRAALRAVSPAGDAIGVDTIRPDDLSAAALEGYRVALLSEVRQLSVAQVEQLERFVQAGGGLAIFLGDRADRVFYNEIMGAASRPLGGLLPAELRTLVEAEGTARPLHILAAELEHPALQRFRGTLRSALAGVAVYRAYAVQPREAWVLATLDRGLPLLVERSYGRGRVVLCTAAPQPRWTNLPLRRAFVPLCNRLVSYLAGGGIAAVGHCVGEDLELLRGGWDVERSVYVDQPDGTRLRAAVKVVGADPVAYLSGAQVRQPGFYFLERHEGRARRVLAVNAPRRESSPDALDLAAAEKLAGAWRLTVLDVETGVIGVGGDKSRAASLLSGGWLSRGVWDTFLWTVFVLLLVEPLIAAQFLRLGRARDRRRPVRSPAATSGRSVRSPAGTSGRPVRSPAGTSGRPVRSPAGTSGRKGAGGAA